jgi:Tfp pilus assembly protein PilO
MKGNSKLIVAMLVVVVFAGAFWMLLISPKREEAGELGKQVETLEASLAQHQSEAATAAAARREFPTNYSQLVVLGKAVPADSETASLLVQIQRIAERADVRFEEINLDSEGGEEAVVPAPEGVESAAPESASPTEVAASTLPLGATIGPAGLGVMPYTLNFTGNFFQIADFIHGLDELVKTANAKVAVTGRLITVNSFSLKAAPDVGFPRLQATFSVTTFLTPPEQGLTAGATPGGPAPTATATPAAETIGGTP